MEAVQTDLHALGDLIRDNGDFRRLVESPAFSTDEKAGALNAITAKAELSELTRNTVAVMARNRRASALPDVIAVFDALAAKDRGVVTAHVASAIELNKTQLTKLTAALKAAVGQTVEIESEVRPDLIGGLVVRVGSRLFDSSLKTKLEGLKAAMKGA